MRSPRLVSSKELPQAGQHGGAVSVPSRMFDMHGKEHPPNSERRAWQCVTKSVSPRVVRGKSDSETGGSMGSPLHGPPLFPR